MARSKKEKKKNRGVKGILAAMLIALLGFFGFNMGLGDPGDGGDATDQGVYEDTIDGVETIKLVGEDGILTLYLSESMIYIDETLEETIEIDELKVILEAMPESGQVVIVDKGTVTKTLAEVEELVDATGLSKKLQ